VNATPWFRVGSSNTSGTAGDAGGRVVIDSSAEMAFAYTSTVAHRARPRLPCGPPSGNAGFPIPFYRLAAMSTWSAGRYTARWWDGARSRTEITG
jgi:hypothetical protein